MQVQPLGRKDPLEEGMTIHSSILAWRIPWTEEPGLQSIKSESDTTEATEHMMDFISNYLRQEIISLSDANNENTQKRAKDREHSEKF